jgi:glutamate synthase (NADPH) large chain
MAANGEEGIGSMGNDSPLAVLSDKNKPLYNYFKQLFAQVTNPPIDPIREAIVMSLVSFIGPKPNLLDINQVNPPMRLEVSQPVLDFADMAKLRNIERVTQGKFRATRWTSPTRWLGQGRRGSQAGLAVRRGGGRDQGRQEHPDHQRPRRQPHAGGRSRAAGAVGHAPAPGARRPAHHRRPGGGNRHRARGAPLRRAGRLRRRSRAPLPGHGNPGGDPQDLPGDLSSADKAIYNYVKAIGKGLSKIMSKMGVSTYMSTAAPSCSRPSA